MIVKTRDPKPAGNKFEQAGIDAEEQMAFYLRRAFGEDPDVWVLNDLRLVEDADDAAQIDHLVLHTYGIFIVESKSVSGEVTVNEHGEWGRKWGNQYNGMPSPIQQARSQGEFLRKLLNKHNERLRDKYIFGMLQGGFKSCPIDICVAISDRGLIKRRGTDLPEVCKADQVCDRIKTIVERHRKGSKLLSKSDGDYGMYRFRPDETERIKAFLIARHTPLQIAAAPPKECPAPPPVPEARPLQAEAKPPAAQPAGTSAREAAKCKYCGSDKLQATYGQYGYYFKCIACTKNTPIDYKCTSCGTKARIRKQGAQFDRVCACGVTQPVWINAQ